MTLEHWFSKRFQHLILMIVVQWLTLSAVDRLGWSKTQRMIDSLALRSTKIQVCLADTLCLWWSAQTTTVLTLHPRQSHCLFPFYARLPYYLKHGPLHQSGTLMSMMSYGQRACRHISHASCLIPLWAFNFTTQMVSFLPGSHRILIQLSLWQPCRNQSTWIILSKRCLWLSKQLTKTILLASWQMQHLISISIDSLSSPQSASNPSC